MTSAAHDAHVIADDAEALEVAAKLAEEFTTDASRRDAERLLPVAELDLLSSSGLLGITVPASHGGADVTATTLAEVFRLLGAADPNIAQIRKATSSMSMSCDTRAMTSNADSSTARCWRADASATRSPRPAPVTSRTSARG